MLDRRGRIVGCTVVSPRAGETIAEATLAIQHGLRAQTFAATMHPYPTFSDGIWNAAVTDVRSQLNQPLIGAGIRVLRHLQRRRLARSAPSRLA